MSRRPGAGPRHYRPGDWYGVLGDGVMLLLPPGERSRVPALWELVDAGAGFEETLDALLVSGLRGLPGFVLLGEEDGTTRVLLRGSARARLEGPDGPVELAAPTGSTWVESTLAGVSGLVVELTEGPGPGELLAVDRGLVRLARLEQAAAPQRPGVDLPTEPHLGPVGDPDHDGLTGAGGPRPASAVPPPPAARVATLAFPDGETLDVDGTLVIGRAPDPGAGDPVRLVRVPSPQQEVSATHLEIRPGSGADRGCAIATDLGSTNGTVLVQPGLPPEDLVAGVPVALLPGAVLDLGDGVTIRVGTP